MEKRAQNNHIQPIFTNHAPQPVGAYSQGILVHNFLFISGQIGLTPQGNLIGEDITSQTKQIFKNIDAMLAVAGCSVGNIVKTTIYLKNIEDFKIANALYEQWIQKPYPARSTVEVAKLPLNALVEIECIVHK